MVEAKPLTLAARSGPREEAQRQALDRIRRHANDAMACSTVMRLIGKAHANSPDVEDDSDTKTDLAAAMAYLGYQLSFHVAEALEDADALEKTLPGAPS